MTADRRITRASWRAHVHLNRISGGRRVYNGRVILQLQLWVKVTSVHHISIPGKEIAVVWEYALARKHSV